MHLFEQCFVARVTLQGLHERVCLDFREPILTLGVSPFQPPKGLVRLSAIGIHSGNQPGGTSWEFDQLRQACVRFLLTPQGMVGQCQGVRPKSGTIPRSASSNASCGRD